MRKLLIACILLSGCGGAPAVYHAPVKIVRGVVPPVVFPVTKVIVKAGASTVKNTVLLPVRVVKDTVPKPAPKPDKVAPKKDKVAPKPDKKQDKGKGNDGH
jgi:hypothetical protein